jgi:threonine dehydrogenase-like Zn-dependent dehydrogenase
VNGAVRAAVIRAPGELQVEQFPYPEPEHGALLLRVLYSGICGTDKHTWRGESKQYAGTAHERDVGYPLICGHENVGVIEAIGAGPAPVDERGTPLEVGDRVVPTANLTCGRCVFCLEDRFPYYMCAATEDYGNSLSCARAPHLFGGWSERMYLLPGTRLFRVPDQVDSQLAAMTELLSVTHGLDMAAALPGAGRFRPGDTVLAIGAGPLGMMHLLKAELMGAGRLIAIDIVQGRLELARACGVDLTLDARALSQEEVARAVREVTAGIGADVAIDCSGHHRTFAQALALARPGGTVIEAGAFVDTGRAQIDPNRDICIKNITVLGIGGDDADRYAESLRLLARHGERFRPLITRAIGLDEVASELEDGGAMKVLVAPNGGEA